MPIVSGEILFRYSSYAGFDQAGVEGTAGSALGGYCTLYPVLTGLHDLFGEVSGDDNATQKPDYRCIFVANGNGDDLTLTNAYGWIQNQQVGGANIAIAVDPAPAAAISPDEPMVQTIADRYTAPSGVSWSTGTTKPAGIQVGDLAPGQVRAIWIRRTPTASAAMDNDSVTIRVEGDTLP